MRYKASEKREIINLVERSSLPVRRTLDRLGIPKTDLLWLVRALPRESEQSDTRGCLHRKGTDGAQSAPTHQAENAGRTTSAILPTEGCMSMDMMS